MDTSDPLDELRRRLPPHGRLLHALRDVVAHDDRLRWLELGCSLGAGGGDEPSDVDAGIGYVGTDPVGLGELARSIATSVGPPIEVLVHRSDGRPDDVRRAAAQCDDAVQLDLVVTPAVRRPGPPDRTIALVDEDRRLATTWSPPSRGSPSPELAREWLVLGWWPFADADTHHARSSLVEAVESIATARGHALRSYTAGRGVPHPSFGLTSLPDAPPFELPDGLAETYVAPSERVDVVAAALAGARLLTTSAEAAVDRLGIGLTTPLVAVTSRRLAARSPDER